jgi:hypothetical protein
MGHIKKHLILIAIICFLLTLLKLWLIQGQSISARAEAANDDRLYINNAYWILKGRWLGPLDQNTLAKGSVYPLWIVFAFISGIPLLLSQHLLYITACIAVLIAIRPLVKHLESLFLIYIILLYNPITFTNETMTRVLRDGIYPALTMFMFAFAIGLFLRQENPYSKRIVWAAGLGISTVALWLTREEGIWVVPFLVLLIGFSVVKMWKAGKAKYLKNLAYWGLSLAIWIGLVFLVSAINYFHYGIFAETEINTKSFQEAYGALTRVKPANWQSDVPVSSEARQRIYIISPAFAELKPYLEGPLGKYYVQIGSTMGTPNEILGGWFMWAFRDAVAAAGYYQSGKYPQAYYRRLANEINTACTDLRLECTLPRASLVPPWRNEYIQPILRMFWEGIRYTTRFATFSAIPSPSIGSPEGILFFENITWGRYQATTKRFYLSGWAVKANSSLSFSLRNKTGDYSAMTLQLSPSQDVYQYLLSRGEDIEEAKYARFKISTSCIDSCTLEVRNADNLLASLPLQANINTPRMISQDPIYLYIDSAIIKGDDELLAEQLKSDRVKQKILNQVGNIFAIFTPWLAILSAIAYIYLSIKLIIKGDNVIEWMVISSILCLYLCRIFLIALVSATSWVAINNVYLASAYPLQLLFIPLSLMTVLITHFVRYKGDKLTIL